MPCFLGVYEKSMPDTLTWEERLDAAARSGFDSVEISIDESDARLARLDWPADQRRCLRQLSQDSGCPLRTMCLSGHRKFPLGSSRAETVQRGMEIMEKAVVLAEDLGVRIIQLAGYDVYYGETGSPSTEQRFRENLAISAEMAAQRGIILALETMENDFLNTVEKGMRFVRAVDSPYLQMYPDIGNLTNACADVIGDIQTGRGHIAAAHLKETREGIFRNLFYGEGRVDFAAIVPALIGQGVRLFTAEFWYDGRPGWENRLREASAFLRPYLTVEEASRS